MDSNSSRCQGLVKNTGYIMIYEQNCLLYDLMNGKNFKSNETVIIEHITMQRTPVW